MLSPKLYKNSHTYDFFIRMLGYERSIERFLRSLDIDCSPGCRILDSGCGTGLLGLHFLERFTAATLVATDLEPNFLRAALANAGRRKLAASRITLGTANISAPHLVTHLDGTSMELSLASFDLICVGAVLGYADDTEASIHKLLELLTPGGYLINLEMNESLTGQFISNRYHYDNMRLDRMHDLIRSQDCEVSFIRLKLRHLPARLTRTAIVARKRI